MSLVSVVIPTYNCSKYVGQALESVFAQSHSQLEIIVVDDGSTDNTCEVVRQFAGAARLYCLDHSGLPAVPRNYGISKSSGEYIAFLDGDDIWAPGKLDKQLAALESDPALGLVSTSLQLIDGDGSPVGDNPELRRVRERAQLLHRDPLLALLQGNVVNTSSAVVRREVLAAAGMFPASPALSYAEDYALWIRVACLAGMIVLPEQLLFYRVHDSNNSRTKTDQRRTEFVRSMAGYVRPSLLASLDGATPAARRQIASLFANAGALCLRNGELKEAGSWIRDSIRADCRSVRTIAWPAVAVKVALTMWMKGQ